jgi:hypothetical protein
MHFKSDYFILNSATKGCCLYSLHELQSNASESKIWPHFEGGFRTYELTISKFWLMKKLQDSQWGSSRA